MDDGTNHRCGYGSGELALLCSEGEYVGGGSL